MFTHLYSQKKYVPPTTPRPRRSYLDEGNWKIIQQDENKEEKKYEFL